MRSNRKLDLTHLFLGTAFNASLALLFRGIAAAASLNVTSGNVNNAGTTTTDGTTNANRNAGANTSSIQQFNTPGSVNGNNSGIINGNGLVLDATQTTTLGDTVSMVNSGSIAPPNNVNPAIGLFTDGGAVNYSGAGSVLNATANGDGIFANGSGLLNTVGGDVTVTAQGAVMGNEGIVASSNFAGKVTVTTSSNVTSADGSNGPFTPQFAINALTENGTAGVHVISGTVTGGIAAQASVGGNVQVQVDGGAIQSNANSAIFAHTLNGNDQVTINGGTLSGAGGLAVAQAFTDFTGTGNVNVTMRGGTIDGTVNTSSFGILATTGVAPVGTNPDTTNTGNVTVETDAGSQIKMKGGTGITAAVFGNTGSTTVTLGGTIPGARTGTDAFIDNPNNASNVTATINNKVDATNIGVSARIQNGTGSVIVDGSGAGNIGQTTAPSQFGILAINNGTGGGGVSATGFGAVTSTGTAISANITNFAGGNVLVQGDGAISGGSGSVFNPNATGADQDPTRGRDGEFDQRRGRRCADQWNRLRQSAGRRRRHRHQRYRHSGERANQRRDGRHHRRGRDRHRNRRGRQ